MPPSEVSGDIVSCGSTGPPGFCCRLVGFWSGVATGSTVGFDSGGEGCVRVGSSTGEGVGDGAEVDVLVLVVVRSMCVLPVMFKVPSLYIESGNR